MLGVVKLVPVPKDTPPVAAAYQLMVPADAVAPKLTVPASHREPGVVAVMLGPPVMVASTCVRVLVVQVPSFAST